MLKSIERRQGIQRSESSNASISVVKEEWGYGGSRKRCAACDAHMKRLSSVAGAQWDIIFYAEKKVDQTVPLIRHVCNPVSVDTVVRKSSKLKETRKLEERSGEKVASLLKNEQSC